MRSRGNGNLIEDLGVVGESALLLLREDQLVVEDHFELAPGTFDQRRVDAPLLLDLGRQTGGPWQVVSGHAVGDLELHGVLLV
jgi:hypothetical protein